MRGGLGVGNPGPGRLGAESAACFVTAAAARPALAAAPAGETLRRARGVGFAAAPSPFAADPSLAAPLVSGAPVVVPGSEPSAVRRRTGVRRARGAASAGFSSVVVTGSFSPVREARGGRG